MKKYKDLKEKKKMTIASVNEDALQLQSISKESMRVSNVAKDAENIIEDIDKKFEEVTKLDKVDISFLFFAVALQCVRQYYLTNFEERTDHDKSEKKSKKKEKKIFNKYFKGDDLDKSDLYHASLNDILIKGVPYDTMYGSEDFDLGLSGPSHRFRTLGHDPLLGWVFGTANIMTRTLTDWKSFSYHVEDRKKSNGILLPKIVERASTGVMFDKVWERAKSEPQIMAAAVIKQGFHLKSDEYSKVGLPIPVVSTISPEFMQKLASHGIDHANVKTVGNQAAGAIMINTLIAMIHGMFYDESKYESWELYEVKTRRILSYSNIIASSSNIIGVAIAEKIAIDTENEDLAKKAINYIDVGGYLVTLYRIVNDHKFIKNIKQEFMEKEFYSMVMGNEDNTL